MSNTCSICNKMPERVEGDKKIAKFRKKLEKLGDGRYYRGEEMQLSTFNLLKCSECNTYYEDGHHYYSDPESTMGLGRDEDDWYTLIRLSETAAQKLLAKL